MLSTFDDQVFSAPLAADYVSHTHLADDAFREMYEVDRTIAELVAGGYSRVALQFPDERLADSERVYKMIYTAINAAPLAAPADAGPCASTPAAPAAGCCGGKTEKPEASCCGGKTEKPEASCCGGKTEKPEASCCGRKTAEPEASCCGGTPAKPESACCAAAPAAAERKVFILADTSYAACCVDEVAAEHVAADVLVHYGRACLSPTSRLPVVYVFTLNALSLSAAVAGFAATYPDRGARVLLVADVTYASHTAPLHAALAARGYTHVFATAVVHDPAAPVPNRTLPAGAADLRDWALFHVGAPPAALLLVLAARVGAAHFFEPGTGAVVAAGASALLRRRYALLSHARSAGVVGVLINTINVRQYLPMIARLKRQLAGAGRKAYLVVVGKVNVEKVANFAEIEVWVGVGCWEQGVVGGPDGRGWFRPVITPWELGIALGEREWTGGWVADFAEVLRLDAARPPAEVASDADDGDSDEDAPPEYDLRTGRYISTARPLRRSAKKAVDARAPAASSALTASSNRQRELIASGGVFSPGANFLNEKRTWTGLGSDLAPAEEGGALVEEGRSGVARGYVVGEEGRRH